MGRVITIRNNLIQDLIYSGAICGFIWWANNGPHSLLVHVVSRAVLYFGYIATGWLVLVTLLLSETLKVILLAQKYSASREDREWHEWKIAQEDADVRRLGVATNTRALRLNNTVDAVFAVAVCSFIWWANNGRHGPLLHTLSKAFLYLGCVVAGWLALMPFVFIVAYATGRTKHKKELDSAPRAANDEETPF